MPRACTFLSDLAVKQLGLLRELAPAAKRCGLLVNPDNANAAAVTQEMTAAASAIGIELKIFHANDSSGIDAAFAALVGNKTDALVVGADAFFFSQRARLATLATRHAVPAIFTVREFAEAGGLMSNGASLVEAFRHIGAYVGHILKGARPTDLPVMQSTKFDFVINLIARPGMSQQTEFASVDHKVASEKEVLWNHDAQRGGRLSIYDELELRRLFDGKVTWFSALEYFGCDICGLAV
jgi:ABC-type uncharacterized transport system substrate-binding protein